MVVGVDLKIEGLKENKKTLWLVMKNKALTWEVMKNETRSMVLEYVINEDQRINKSHICFLCVLLLNMYGNK